MECESLFSQNIPCRTSMLGGMECMLYVLVENPTRCYESVCMRPYVFQILCDKLKLKNLMWKSKAISVKEIVAKGLVVLVHWIK